MTTNPSKLLNCLPGVGHLRDDGFVRERHGESADGVLLEAVVEVAQRLIGLHLQAVVQQLGATRRLAVLVPHPEMKG